MHYWFLLLALGADVREVTYGGAANIGGEIVPLYENGHLVYFHRSNRLRVFGPDTNLAFDKTLPCPVEGACSLSTAAVDRRGYVAAGFGALGGRGNGIQILDPKGNPVRFLATPGYVPAMLCFDAAGHLWTLGWQRDSMGDVESKEDYKLVRKYSIEDGRLLLDALPRSTWPQPKTNPGGGGRGFWRMAASAGKIGVMVHESWAHNPPEWVEWDLEGKLVSRTVVETRFDYGRAFNGRLYGMTGPGDLKVLDTKTGTWDPVADALPQEPASLLGSDGESLVFRAIGSGNVRLLHVRPGTPK